MEQILKLALNNVAVDYAEIRLEEKNTTVVHYSGPELDEIGNKHELGGNIRICHNGGWSYVSFNSLENLPDKVALCARQAQLVGKGKTRLAPLPVIQKKIATAYRIDPRTIDLEEKQLFCKGLNDQLLAYPQTTTTSVYYRDFYKHLYFINSEGSYLEQELINTGLATGAYAKEGTNIQHAFRSRGDYHGYENVQDFATEVEEVIKEAEELLKAPKVTGGIYTVILDPRMAGVFTHEAFGHLSEADFLYANPELKKKMELGRRFGPDGLNIVDNGALPDQNGYVAFDDEGAPGSKTYLIKNGILAGRLHSRETAAVMGEAVTGNARAINYRHAPIVRMTNTYIEPGTTSFAEMLASIGHGLYVVGALGGQTDLEKFSFSSEKAYQIKDGKLGPLVRDVILAGNVFTTLANIEMIGNDLKLFGGLGGCGKAGQSPLPVSDGSPHLKIKDLVIGGK